MATKGYDPYVTLAGFFFEWANFTPEELQKVRSVVGLCLEERMHPPEMSLTTRFLQRVEEDYGEDALARYTADDLDLIEGMLQCLHNRNTFWHTLPEGVRPHGIYDHFKGGVYKIRGLSEWAGGGQVVEYTSMIFGTDHTRLLREWCEVVQWPDGKHRSRFVYRGADLSTPPPSFKVQSPTLPY